MRVFVLDAASVASARSVQIRRDYFSVVDDASVALLSMKVLMKMFQIPGVYSTKTVKPESCSSLG